MVLDDQARGLGAQERIVSHRDGSPSARGWLLMSDFGQPQRRQFLEVGRVCAGRLPYAGPSG
jgi:hypothetical protein